MSEERDRYKDQPALAHAAECACTYYLTNGFCGPRNAQQCKCWDHAAATMAATGLSARAVGWIYEHLRKIETQAEVDETKIFGGTPLWSKNTVGSSAQPTTGGSITPSSSSCSSMPPATPDRLSDEQIEKLASNLERLRFKARRERETLKALRELQSLRAVPSREEALRQAAMDYNKASVINEKCENTPEWRVAQLARERARVNLCRAARALSQPSGKEE